MCCRGHPINAQPSKYRKENFPLRFPGQTHLGIRLIFVFETTKHSYPHNHLLIFSLTISLETFHTIFRFNKRSKKKWNVALRPQSDFTGAHRSTGHALTTYFELNRSMPYLILIIIFKYFQDFRILFIPRRVPRQANGESLAAICHANDFCENILKKIIIINSIAYSLHSTLSPYPIPRFCDAKASAFNVLLCYRYGLEQPAANNQQLHLKYILIHIHTYMHILWAKCAGTQQSLTVAVVAEV